MVAHRRKDRVRSSRYFIGSDAGFLGQFISPSSGSIFVCNLGFREDLLSKRSMGISSNGRNLGPVAGIFAFTRIYELVTIFPQCIGRSQSL